MDTKIVDNWLLKEEDLEELKDQKEKETGVFHWRDKDGSYKPVTKMSREELKHAEEVCKSRLDRLNDSYTKACKNRERVLVKLEKAQEDVVKTNSNIRYLREQLNSWSYREEQIAQALFEKEEGLSEEALEGTKEIVE